MPDQHRVQRGLIDAEVAHDRDHVLEGMARSPSRPTGGAGSARRCPGRGRCARRVRRATSVATVAATSRSDGGQRPGPRSEWSKPKRSKPSVAPRSARARSSSGRSIAVLRWPRMTRSGSAPAASRILEDRRALVAPRMEMHRDRAGRAPRMPPRPHGGPGPPRVGPGPRCPISPRIPGRMPVSSMPWSAASTRRVGDRVLGRRSRPTARGPARGTGRSRARRGSRRAPRSPGPAAGPGRAPAASAPRSCRPPARTNGASSSTAASTSVSR